jgi:hypothetical protein
VEAAYPVPAGNAEQKSSPFGIASVICAGLAVLLPPLIMLFAGMRADRDTSDPTHFWGPLAILVAGGLLAVLVAGLSGLVGSITGGVALARKERQSWLAVIGLIVNVPITLSVLYLILAVRANNGG